MPGGPGRYGDLLHRALSLLLFFTILFLAVSFVGQGTRVVGRSMEDAFLEGDCLFVSKLAYRLHGPKRFDVVVFPFEEEDGTALYVKRVIGLPGEEVQIAGDAIYIDGSRLLEDYGKEAMEYGTAGIAGQPLLLGEDEYFVLGDNRNCSADSRQPGIGPIRGERIIGKVAFRIWPWR